jgi:hypothetical protein
MSRVMLYVSVTVHLATLFLDVVTYLFSYFEKLATIKCSHFAEVNIIRTTQAPMAITFLLFIDRHYKRLPGDDIATLSTAVSVGGLLLSC